MRQVQDVNIAHSRRLITPAALKAAHPAAAELHDFVARSRDTIRDILAGNDKRMLIVVGPCSVHDPKGAMDYARRLVVLHRELSDRFFIVMRVYFEKPRTTVGWKGLISDPGLDDTNDVETGLVIARDLLLEIARLGLPAATEFLDPIVPQYIADLVSWVAIGARTTESQTHRELASGLSMPVGFKNATDGSLQVAVDAMKSSRYPHSFLGIDQEGITAVFKAKGNPWGHMVMRGGNKRTNYDPESIREAVQRLHEAGLPTSLMVDCSHANSMKQHARQEQVWRSVLEQRAGGNAGIIGLMLESYLVEGSQKVPTDRAQLKYGVSITDACISWESTERLLREGHGMLGSARHSAAATA